VTRDSRLVAATFAGGCFWCLEAVFQPLRGVSRVVSGYIGGRMPSPSYEAVCSGMTGHAEAVQLIFEPAVISYRTLLELFFAFHDPTTLNRQGPDAGTQYRSAIYTHGAEQEGEARAVVKELTDADVFGAPIVTEVLPAPEFFPAEAYHQQYYERNSRQPYCHAMIAPKVAKLRSKYAALLAS
jgi:peptide-methionine (S)-S-oxide reductase